MHESDAAVVCAWLCVTVAQSSKGEFCKDIADSLPSCCQKGKELAIKIILSVYGK